MSSLDVATSWMSSIARLGAGLRVGELGPRPAKPLEIYEFEGCPFCRKVRDALSELDLEAVIYPCPKGGERYRPIVRDKGHEMFPYLIDPNTEVKMYESNDINRYLFKTYGTGELPLHLSLGPATTISSASASLWRPTRGSRKRQSKLPSQMLELWSFEASPYCRLVREVLCELELPYLLHNVAKGSPSRDDFVARSGKMQVPYLADPNTDRELFESGDIVRYLDETYGS